MVAIMHGKLDHWYADGDEKRTVQISGSKFTLDTKGAIKLIGDDWFVQAQPESSILDLWGDEDKFYRDVTLLRLFGIPSAVE